VSKPLESPVETYPDPVSTNRKCSRPLCSNNAIATLTYVYGESTMVLGPLATFNEPHCYDLCDSHSQATTPPRGWELVKLETDPESLKPSTADLEQLAQAVRDSANSSQSVGELENSGRRGHLQVVRDL
jgi:hypothetical protein